MVLVVRAHRENTLTLMGVVHYGYEMSNMLLKNKKRKKGGK